MAIWKAPRERRNTARATPRALQELAARLESNPDAVWTWIERLQSTHRLEDAGAEHARGVVPTPPDIAARMADALLRGTPPGAAWRVLDAGCGRGRLLGAVARAAAAAAVQVDCEGIELDATTARWAQALEPLVRAGARGAVRSWSVRRADFLLAPSPSADCDAVIANPPYVPLRQLDAGLRERLRGRMPRGGAGDLAALFVARILDRLRPGGRMAVIVPNKLLAAHYAGALRRRLLTEISLEEVWDFTGTRVFAGWGSYPVVLIARNAAPDAGHRVRVLDAQGALRSEWPQSALAAMPDGVIPLGLDPELAPLAERLFAGPHLGSQVRVACGIAVAGFGRAIGAGADRILCAGDIAPFRTAAPRPFAAARAGVRPASLERMRVPKILIPGMFRRLCAAWEPGDALLGRVYYVPARPQSPERDLLLALLNSRLYGVLYAGLFAGVAQSGGYLRLNAPYLNAMPWPRRAAARKLATLVAALERREGAAERGALDRAVEDLFELSPSERRVLDRLAREQPSAVPIPHGSRPTAESPAATPIPVRTISQSQKRRSILDSDDNSVGMDVA